MLAGERDRGGSVGAAGHPAEEGAGGPWSSLVSFLRRHPVVSLALLTPGIVEYLSTSSSVLLLFESPPVFFVLLAVNVGQYTAGALLVREAMIRWGKGWATVGFLGLAYGITEEGLGDNTLFRGGPPAEGVLGSYGHFLGVNWVWAVGVLTLHVVVSLALPIVVLGLAIPRTRGRPLLSGRSIVVCLATVVGSTVFEAASVRAIYGFWMGEPRLVGALIAIFLLLLLGYFAPRSWWSPVHEHPSAAPRTMFLLGLVFYGPILAAEYLLEAIGAPAAVAVTAAGLVVVVQLEVIRRQIGRRDHDRLLVELAFGMVVFWAAFGVVLNLGLPYSLPLVAVAVYFFLRLRRAYPGTGPMPPLAPPPPATRGVSGPLV